MHFLDSSFRVEYTTPPPPPPPPDDVTSQMTTALIIFRDKDSLPLQARQLPLNSSRLEGLKASVFDTGDVNYQPRIVRKLGGEFNFPFLIKFADDGLKPGSTAR